MEAAVTREIPSAIDAANIVSVLTSRVLEKGLNRKSWFAHSGRS